MTCYKVVRLVEKAAGEQGARYESCKIEDGPVTSYALETWSEAPGWMANRGYHLLVFDTLKDAKFWTNLNDWVILECECEEEADRLPVMLYWHSSHRWKERLERGDGLRDLEDSGRRWPDGTRMFKRVRPLREV